MAIDNSANIQTNAQQPRRATIDGNSAEQHPLKDQIEADRYEASVAAKKSKKAGIRLMQFRNQGSL